MTSFLLSWRLMCLQKEVLDDISGITLKIYVVASHLNCLSISLEN